MTRTTTTRTKPSLMSRLTGRRNGTVTTTTTTKTTKTIHPARQHRGTATTTAAGHHHQRRRPSLGDKISGAMMRLRGSLSHRPGEKAAGTRRMRGTDGRGTHRTY